MHVEYIGKTNNAVAVHAGDAWHLFSYDTLVAIHKDGDELVHVLQPSPSRTTTTHLKQFISFVMATPVAASADELREMSVP